MLLLLLLLCFCKITGHFVLRLFPGNRFHNRIAEKLHITVAPESQSDILNYHVSPFFSKQLKVISKKPAMMPSRTVRKLLFLSRQMGPCNV